MCRIVGLIRTREETPLPAWQQLVGAPNSLRAQAETGCVPPDTDPGHLDSWGVGWFDLAGDVSLLRQTGSAGDSAYFVFASEAAARGTTASGPARTIVAHLRKASVGVVTSENAHPVRVDYSRTASDLPPRPYDTLLVAHNGTIRQPLQDSLRVDAESFGREEAGADSDTVLLAGWLAGRLGEAPGAEPFETLTEALRDLLARAHSVAVDGDLTTAYTAINLVLAHVTGLYALRQFSTLPDYYTLSVRALTPETDEGATGYVIASEPTDRLAGWTPLTPGVLIHFAPDGTVREARVDAPL